MKALMISINFDTQDVITTWFANSDDPVLTAEEFRVSVGDDFPNYEHRIVADEEAQLVVAARRVERLIGQPKRADGYTEA